MARLKRAVFTMLAISAVGFLATVSTPRAAGAFRACSEGCGSTELECNAYSYCGADGTCKATVQNVTCNGEWRP